MITAGDFLSSCLDWDFSFFTGTPCSYLKPIINYVIEVTILLAVDCAA